MYMTKEDIEVGVVISFVCSKLNSCIKNGQIKEISRKYGVESKLKGGGRPFVCIGHHEGRSQWAELTTKDNGHRLEIDKAWRTSQASGHNCQQSADWINKTQYINGAVFVGDDDVWVSISNDNASSGCYRMITNNGIEAIKNKLASELQSPIFA